MTGKFDLLGQMGFQTPAAATLTTTQLPAFFANEKAHRDEQPYEYDGLVIAVDSVPVQEQLGFDTAKKKPKGQIALKFPSKGEIVTIREVNWSAEGAAYLSPVGTYDPTEIGGAECTHVHLKSIRWMEQNKVGVGTVLRVTRSGDVIPTINDKVDNWLVDNTLHEITPPESCPVCGAPVIAEGAYLACSEDACPAKEAARINKFLTSLRVKGLAHASLLGYTQRGVTLLDFFQQDEFRGVTDKIRGAEGVSMVVWEKVRQQLVVVRGRMK